MMQEDLVSTRESHAEAEDLLQWARSLLEEALRVVDQAAFEAPLAARIRLCIGEIGETPAAMDDEREEDREEDRDDDAE